MEHSISRREDIEAELEFRFLVKIIDFVGIFLEIYYFYPVQESK